MSPSSRPNRPQSRAEARKAAEAAARRAARRRQERLLGIGSVVAVVVILAGLVVLKATGGGGARYTRTPVSAAAYADYAATPVSTLAAAAHHYSSKDLYGYPAIADAAEMSSGGKPEVLFIGAEFCPYCATERWALVLALSKFGTFHHLTAIRSSATDTDPNTPTWSFYGATYTSPYLSLVTVETETDTHQTLQQPTASQIALLEKYGDGDIPFIDFDGKAILDGVEYNPSLLAHLSFAGAAKRIEANSSPLASAVDADAGAMISDLCRVTGDRPASVCQAFPSPVTKVA